MILPLSTPLFLKNFKAKPGVNPKASGFPAKENLISPKSAPLNNPS